MSAKKPFNTLRAEPELKDLLDVFKRDIFLTLNCHALATVQSYNDTKQTIKATINYSRTFSDGYGNLSTKSYPTLVDVPVLFIGYETFPVAAGMQALILFNDRDIDNWSANPTGGESPSPNSSRLHSFADGLALIFNPAVVYDAARALISDGTAMVGVNTTNHKVYAANGTTNLNAVLSNLTSTLTTLVSSIATALAAITTPGGGPAVVSAWTAATTTLTADIAAANMAIGALLDT
jgi:hypothetical protein